MDSVRYYCVIKIKLSVSQNHFDSYRGLVEDAIDENGIPADSIGPIINEATWKEEKNFVFGNHRDHFSPALFLYCMLNE